MIIDENHTLMMFSKKNFGPTFDLLHGVQLLGPAFYMIRFVKRAGTAKENTCLLVWNICNLFVMAANLIIMALISTYVCHEQDEYEHARFTYYYSLLCLVATFMDFYCDLFLIVLLVRLVYFRDWDYVVSEKKAQALALENMKED